MLNSKVDLEKLDRMLKVNKIRERLKIAKNVVTQNDIPVIFSYKDIDILIKAIDELEKEIITLKQSKK